MKMLKLRAFILGAREFRKDLTMDFDADPVLRDYEFDGELLDVYDRGAAFMRRITFGRFGYR